MDLLRPVRGGWAAAAEAAVAAPASGSVDTYTVRQQFNFDWTINQTEFAELDTYSWWATSIRVDPDEIWAEDDEGTLWVVPFATDGAMEVTFGQPERARLVAVPATASAGAQANQMVSRARQRALASNLERPEKPGRASDPDTAAAEPAPDERSPMDTSVRQALARLHGLDPESATETEVNAAVLAAETQPDPGTAPRAEAGTEPEPVESDQYPLAAAAAALGLPASATPEEIAAAAETVRRGSEAGAQVARNLEGQTIDREIDQAIQDGRIFPSSRDAWRAACDPGEHPTSETSARAARERQALAGLATNRVPVRERGATPEPGSQTASASLTRALVASGLTTNRKPEGA